MAKKTASQLAREELLKWANQEFENFQEEAQQASAVTKPKPITNRGDNPADPNLVRAHAIGTGAVGLVRKRGWLYFVGKDGHVWRVRMKQFRGKS